MPTINWTAVAVIVAIIAPFAHTWFGHWLKSRPKSQTAKIKPAFTQPKAIDQLLTREINFWGFLKRSWLRILIQWAGNLTAVGLMVWQYRSNAPLTRPSVVLIALIASLWVYFSIMFHIIDEKISN
jgi:hypothetical protein